MSKVIIAMDTEAKTLDVSVNDKAIAGVTEAYAYQSFDQKGKVDGVYINVTTREMDEDVRKVTSYIASASELDKCVTIKTRAAALSETLASILGK